ncbi:MAG: glycosyltransferase [Planctomycetota bacterium]
MNALFLVQQHDYGDPQRGLSFEYVNFHPTLVDLGYHVTVFDYPSEVRQRGRSAANRRLWEIVSRDKPEVLFGVLRRDYISRRVMRRISEQTETTTINWFCDDHWQFDQHTLRWAPCFNYVVTTSMTALAKYPGHGIGNVIKSQWGAHPRQYRRPTPSGQTPMKYDVSFVGQPYGNRLEAVRALGRAGIRVHAWGHGWPEGKLSHAQMVDVFAASRINLNFADASQAPPSRLEVLANSSRVERLKDKPVLWRGWRLAQRAAAAQKRLSRPADIYNPRQIKGRVFEVPCCGGFLLTQPAENLNAYLSIGKECAVFDDVDDLVNRVRYYLAKEDERAAVAEAGYRRVIAEHQWAQRLVRVFNQAGVRLPQAETPAVDDAMWRRQPAGRALATPQPIAVDPSPVRGAA